METQYSILYNATYPKEKLKEDFIRYFCDKIPKEYHEIVRRHIIKRFDDVSIILVPKDLKSFFIKKFELKTNNHEQAVKIYEWLENLTLMVKKSNFAFFDFYQMFLDPNKSIITETHKTAEDGVSNDTTISNKQLMEILGFDLYSTLSSTEIMKNFEEFVYWAKQLFLSQPSATKKDIKAQKEEQISFFLEDLNTNEFYYVHKLLTKNKQLLRKVLALPNKDDFNNLTPSIAKEVLKILKKLNLIDSNTTLEECKKYLTNGRNSILSKFYLHVKKYQARLNNMVFMDLYKETPLFAEMYQHIKAGAQRKLLLDSLHKQGFEEAYQILVDNNLMLKDILQITPLETCQLPINSVLQTFKELKLISEDTTFSSFEELTALIEKNDKLSKFISILKNALVNTLLKDDFKYNINDCICDLFYGNTIAQFVTNQETTDLIAITINDDYHLSDITHELIHALSFSNNLKKTPDKELVALDEICTEFLTQDLIQNIDKDLVDYTNIGEKIVRKPLNHQYEIPIQRDNCGYTRTVLAFERLLNFFKPELKKDYLCIAYKSLRTAIGEKNYEKLAYLAKTHMDTPIPYFKHSFKPINNDQEFITAFENLDENNYTDKTEYEMLKKYYKLAVKVREFCNEIIDNYLNEMNKNIGDM